jgi:drug/metabolite transporter (DMT)-like permease
MRFGTQTRGTGSGFRSALGGDARNHSGRLRTHAIGGASSFPDSPTLPRFTRLAIAAAPMLFVLLWSTGFIGARYGLPYVEPMTFLALRMLFVVALLVPIALLSGARWPTQPEAGHSLVVGLLVHGTYLGGVFTAISQGVPVGISALMPGLQPLLTSTIANRFMGETVTRLQWLGLALGLAGVLLVLHDRSIVLSGTPLGWAASVASLLGITLGTLYQKRFCGAVDWRTGNLVQYAGAGVWFSLLAFAFETRVVHWTGELIFAMTWLVLVLSIVGVALMYWLIRRSAATGFASLFYLVPAVTALLAYFLFNEKLDALSIAGILLAAVGVVLANRGGLSPRAPRAAVADPAE